jgi:hypothetical protein
MGPQKSNLLNSWKEIANYLDRGVRTVQRWELELAMPVRRPRSHSRSPVLALPEEIDAWLRTKSPRELNRPAQWAKPHGNGSILSDSMRQSEELRQRCETLRNENYVAVAHLLQKVDSIRLSLSANDAARRTSSNGRQHSAAA